MKLQTEVKNWIESNGHFGAGIAFLLGIGKSEVYIRLVPYLGGFFVPAQAKEELKYVLTKWLETQPPLENVQEEFVEVEETAKVVTKKEEPQSVFLLREDAKRLHKRHSFVNANLHQADSDEKRFELAREIMEDIIPKLDNIYDQIRDYHKSGTLPEVPTTNVVKETVEKMQRLQSIRSRISRLKGFLEGKLNDKKKEEYTTELLSKEKEAMGIEKELGL